MKTVLSFIVITLFLSCGSSWDEGLLEGKWKTVEWIKLDNNELLTNQMDFILKVIADIVLIMVLQLKKGKYWVSGEYLHTVEDGRAEKKVRIINLSSDSLVFEMNRAGYLEQVSLIKM